jgi:hypothetical protein
MDDTSNRVVGQTSVEVNELVEILAAVPVGETIAYRDMSRKLGIDVIVCRHILESARRIAMREHKAVFATQTSFGLRRLSDVETVTICPESRRKKIRQQAKNNLRELSTVDYQKLPQEKQISHNVGLAFAGAVYVSTERASVKKLEHKIANGEMPDVDGTLKLIGWTSD